MHMKDISFALNVNNTMGLVVLLRSLQKLVTYDPFCSFYDPGTIIFNYLSRISTIPSDHLYWVIYLLH